jgi:hypothetical protein
MLFCATTLTTYPVEYLLLVEVFQRQRHLHEHRPNRRFVQRLVLENGGLGGSVSFSGAQFIKLGVQLLPPPPRFVGSQRVGLGGKQLTRCLVFLILRWRSPRLAKSVTIMSFDSCTNACEKMSGTYYSEKGVHR